MPFSHVPPWFYITTRDILISHCAIYQTGKQVKYVVSEIHIDSSFTFIVPTLSAPNLVLTTYHSNTYLLLLST